jgi:hypothetical protein
VPLIFKTVPCLVTRYGGGIYFPFTKTYPERTGFRGLVIFKFTTACAGQGSKPFAKTKLDTIKVNPTRNIVLIDIDALLIN